MKREAEAVLLRIFIGESDKYNGKPLHKYIVDLMKKENIAGATVLRGLGGFGKTSVIHTTSILRLSSDLPLVIEIVDKEPQIEKVKQLLDGVVTEGLITEEKVKVIFYEGRKEKFL